MADLFSQDEGDPGFGQANALDPLAVRMRPRTMDEIVGQSHLTYPGSPLQQLAQASAGERAGASSVILWGPPGVGKTTIAHVVSHAPDRRFVELSAITAGVKDVRQVVENARSERELYGRTTVLFLDEIHRFSKAQQDALLPAVENRLIVLIAATTENPSFSVIAPLVSRSLVLTLQPLEDADVAALIDRAMADPRGLAGSFELEPAARDYLVQIASGDARRSLTVLEAAAGIAEARAEPGGAGVPLITEAFASQAADQAVLRYDRAGDQHYDVVSAFIKSIRGSDPDAALHYLARMIAAGEDPRFICRRVVISAAEDIGMADPQALPLAVAAQTAVERIGMPEGRIPLAEAVVYLACAPKSNASYMALEAALSDVRAGKSGEVPAHLRDAHYLGAKALGHGEGYRYAHSYPHSIAEQEYLPESLRGTEYYRPGSNGAERPMGERLAAIKRIRTGQAPPAPPAVAAERPAAAGAAGGRAAGGQSSASQPEAQSPPEAPGAAEAPGAVGATVAEEARGTEEAQGTAAAQAGAESQGTAEARAGSEVPDTAGAGGIPEEETASRHAGAEPGAPANGSAPAKATARADESATAKAPAPTRAARAQRTAAKKSPAGAKAASADKGTARKSPAKAPKDGADAPDEA